MQTAPYHESEDAWGRYVGQGSRPHHNAVKCEKYSEKIIPSNILTQWPESARELNRRSYRRLSEKLVWTFAIRGASRSQRGGYPTAVISVFLNGAATFSIKQPLTWINVDKTKYSETCIRRNLNKAEICSMWANSIVPARRISVIYFV
jgi:hypothetical protein